MKFDKFYNKHDGERCFILGNAPSLADEDLSLLRDETVFIVNKGYNAVSIGLDHFNYFVLTDPRVYSTDYKDIQNKVTCPRFYIETIKNNTEYKAGPGEDFVPIKRYFKKFEGSLDLFNNQIPKKFEDGWGKSRSVVFDAALIAFFMGFKEIYFLGVELYHNPEDRSPTHFYKTSSREERSRGEINRKFEVVKTIIKNLDNHFAFHNVKLINLSKGFLHKNLMKTSTLEEIIREKNT